MIDHQVHPSSYRDPAGFVFLHGHAFYRQVNNCYASHYRHLMDSGLYGTLTKNELLIPHTEIHENLTGSPDFFKTLQPVQIPFISYPYEWSFDMLKDAALLTLRINKIAMDHGMILKDATAFNIQFLKGKPVFIDTLSFEKYEETAPWIAYRQFCESFLFPLYLSHYVGADMIRMLGIYPDGIPLHTAADLLPFKSRFNLGIWLHVFLQKRISRANIDIAAEKTGFSRKKLFLLIDDLASSCERLKSSPASSWSNYYNNTILSKSYLDEKEKIFLEYLEMISFRSAIDIGANEGHFSKIVLKKADWTVSADMDSSCINSLYNSNKKSATQNILPLIVDLRNPSPSAGFCNLERASFTDRAHADLVIALALVHHLSLANNIPLARIAQWLQAACKILIIEFVPKEDIKAQELLRNKKDIYDNYSEFFFEKHFGGYFDIVEKRLIPGTDRKLYLMRRKS